MEETIFSQGEKYFDALCLDIDQAKSTIDLETYIFNNDFLGQQIADRLIAAANRGVKIRILVDGAGTPNWGDSLTIKLTAANIKTQVFHPFPWRLWQWRHTIIHLPFLLKIFYFFSKMNKRNHRKVCIIDHSIIYIGSANISACHLSKNRGGKGWRDTIVKLKGVEVSDLETAYELAWQHSNIQERLHHFFGSINTRSIVRLNTTRHRRRVLYKHLLRRLTQCKLRLWITNAYFVPDNILLKKLIDRAQSGIDVRILLPQKSDFFLMTWATSAFYESLLKAGVRIFEYTPSMLHAKTLILDDWIMVGSSNLNHRSLLHDLEVDANIQLPSSKEIIEQQFLEDLSHSKEIELRDWHKRSWLQKIIGRLVLYTKYWI